MPQPVGRVHPGGILFSCQRGPLACKAAQQGIYEFLVRPVAARLSEIDRRADGGVGGRVHEQQLTSAKPQNLLNAFCLVGQWAVQGGVDEGVDLAHPPQRGRHQGAGEPTIAAVQGSQGGVIGQGLIQRPFSVKHRLQQVQRHRAGGLGLGVSSSHGAVMPDARSGSNRFELFFTISRPLSWLRRRLRLVSGHSLFILV